MEAALRTVYEIVTGKTLENVEFEAVRGTEGIKEATIDLNGTQVNVAVAHGTGNASELLEKIKSGEKQYHFIEVMGCPGGCVTGGGQPILTARQLMNINPKELRAKALYDEDRSKPVRKSHENSEVQQIYREFLGEPAVINRMSCCIPIMLRGINIPSLKINSGKRIYIIIKSLGLCRNGRGLSFFISALYIFIINAQTACSGYHTPPCGRGGH